MRWSIEWYTHPMKMIIEKTAPTMHTNNIELHSYFISVKTYVLDVPNEITKLIGILCGVKIGGGSDNDHDPCEYVSVCSICGR